MSRTTLHAALSMLAIPVALAISVAPPVAAVTYDLAAVEATTILPDAQTVDMWAFAADTGSCPASPIAWEVGPTLEVPPGDPTLTVNLRNCLAVPVSVFVPGAFKPLTPVFVMDGEGRSRVSSFDVVTPIGGATTQVYEWTGLDAGTYLYHSGTHPQVQVQMGLYGALKKDAASGQAYPGVSYDRDVTLLYSEIDPAMHLAVAGGTYGTAAYPSTFDYRPRYFLINGAAYDPAALDYALVTSETTLLRFVNAGLKSHAPTLQHLYMSIVAEDGNPQPYARQQYSIDLAAGKTMDAVLIAPLEGRYGLYDRDLHLTNNGDSPGGMITFFDVADAVGAPVAIDDSYPMLEDGMLTVAAPGVLGNDEDSAGAPIDLLVASAALVQGPSAGVLTAGLGTDGAFEYTPDPQFNGGDSFTYRVNDGGSDSNVATVSIGVDPVNDAPVAIGDTYDAIEGQVLVVAAPGVLANDSDIDGDALEAALVTDAGFGTLSLATNGSFTYNPGGIAGSADFFEYEATDPDLLPSAVVRVDINVVGGPDNQPPTANDDYATTVRNTATTFNVVTNDDDPDGVIVPASMVVTSGSVSQRGGTVLNLGDGRVTYTPRRNFRGTDSFTYTVEDDDGAVSNEATVRVNVVKP